MSIDEYNSLDREGKFATVMFAYIPHPLDKTALGILMEDLLGANLSDAPFVIKELRSRKLIAACGLHENKYRGCSRFHAKDLVAILREAEEQGWLPNADALARALERFSATSTEIRVCGFQAECARAILTGTATAISGGLAEALDSRSGLRIARGGAWHAAMMADDEPDFSLAGDTGSFRRLMRYWLNLRFLEGCDVRKALAAMEAAFRAGDAWDWRLLASFAALCFWTGWRQGFDALPCDSADFGGNEDAEYILPRILAGCRFALDGDFAAADKAFKCAEKFDEAYDINLQTVECRLVDNLPERFLAAMSSAVANPDKIAKIRPAKIMRCRWPGGGYWRNGNNPEEAYADHVANFSIWFSDNWRNVLSGRGRLLAEYNGNNKCVLMVGIVLAWDYRMLATGHAAMRGKATALLSVAERAEREGYVNMARLALELLSGGYDKTAAEDMLRRLSPTTVGFLPESSGDIAWKNLLAAMGKVVKDATRTAKRGAPTDAERLVWRIEVDEPTDGILAVSNLKAAVREADAPADGSHDRPISCRWELEKKSVRRLFSEKDMAIARAVMDHGGLYSSNVRREVLPMLVGLDNVNLCTLKRGKGIYFDKVGETRPVKVVSGKCEMRSAVSADGGMDLSVPKWALTTSEDVLLRKEDDDTVAVVEITDEVRKLIWMFRDVGIDGKISIPAAAMRDAAPILEAMSAILPVAAPTEAEKTNLRRVAASTAFAARLAFAGDELTVHVVAKPIASMPSLVVEPGEGQTEKIVADASGNFLLERDLAAETSKLADVKSAMSDFETWHDGKSSWAIDDVAVALSALSALKAIADSRPGDMSLEWIDDKKVSVSVAPKSGVRLGSTRTAEDWFRVDGEFALDDGRVLSVARMIDAARTRVGDYVKLSDGDYVRLSKAMSRQIDALAAASRRKGDGVEIPKAAIPMLDGAFDGGDGSIEMPEAMSKTAGEIRAEFARTPSVPKALAAELRPYQLEGFRWLSRLAACGFGSCLADDMGLGKTVQAIALLLERAKDGASLVVAPSSVCGNWRAEISRFAPSLRPVMAYESEGALLSSGPSDVVVASYGYLLFHEDEFASVAWNGVVLDEAQAVKNDASKRAKAVKRLRSKFRIAATGTPVENRLGELWSIFDFLNPGLLGAASSFASRFTKDGMATGELKRLVKPLVLRRLKGDVLDDLPEKTEMTVMVELGKAERTAYEGCRVHALQSLEADAEKGGGEPNRMSILAELTRLRRFCCHPSLVLPKEALPSAKMEALLDLLSNLKEGRHRALVFSQFTDYLAIVRKALDARGWTHLYLDGSTPTPERGRLVSAFQSGEGDFFVISLKAGGTGLNLTAADYVILLDPWWNPAVENQAADRAHRIGQRNPVTVYRLIASDTVEERVLELHKEKRQIAEDVLGGTGSAALSPAQLMGLFRSGADA